MAEQAISAYPETPRRVVSDSFHGVTVAEAYRWLENFDDPEVLAWNNAQNRYSRALLDAVAGRAPIEARLRTLYTATSAEHYGLETRQGMIFAIKNQPPQEQPLLVLLESAEDLASERVLLDPNQLDPSGKTTIDFYEPSLDGRLVAVSLSENGSEEGTLHVYEVATGRELGDLIPRVTYPTAGGSVAWNANGTGIYYTRYPHGDERPPEDQHFFQQVYFHKLGDSIDRDSYAIGADFPRIAEVDLATTSDGRYLLASVANGDGGEYAHFLRDADDSWQQITHFNDQVIAAEFGEDDALYLLSRASAPRGAILRLPLATPALSHARTIVPERDITIEQFTPTATQLYVTELDGGPSQLRVYDLAGNAQGLLPMPPVAAVREVVALPGDQVLIRVNSFTEPPAWFRFSPEEEEPARTALQTISPADFGDVEVLREFATSADGTRVPLNILRRKGIALDGDNPTILYGYGGYGISLSPYFDATASLWLDQGGVYVIANLRGGGEYGEEWHRAGNLTNKQHVFDDFLAAAEHVIAAGYTQPARLAIMGGSNGGLLMGAALTQRPDLFRAVVSYVGIYDMLRVELDPNGAFNVTEFGSVTDPAQFEALHAYSPYHRVVDGTPYPAVLLLTGDHDGRVNPAHSRKMAARLQAATSSGLPVLLRTSANAGHGIGTALNERIAEDTDVYAFLFEQLGMSYTEQRVEL
jgi:prolyl oligopeptidase